MKFKLKKELKIQITFLKNLKQKFKGERWKLFVATFSMQI